MMQTSRILYTRDGIMLPVSTGSFHPSVAGLFPLNEAVPIIRGLPFTAILRRSMNTPLVYVIVINWNGRDHLDACFASLMASSYANTVFLLVDNASSDGSVAFVRERFGDDPRIAILPLDRNLGWSGGNNAGIKLAREAGADYVFLLNNDTATSPEALEALVSAMEQDATLGALAPRMVLFDQPDLLNSVGLCMSRIGAAWDIGIGRLDGPAWHNPEPVIGVCGGACFLRASVLEKTGLLPEDFEIYLDDLDLCIRIWSAGYTIRRCPEAIVRHKFSATMGEGDRARYKYYLNTRNRFRILLRHFPVHRLVGALPCLLLGELRALGRGLLSGQPWRISAHFRAWTSALAYLPEARRFRAGRMNAHPSAFWPLVVSSPLFCPALVLQEDGWYPPVTHAEARLRPIARRAKLQVSPGPLQVRLVNCYPALGPASITLHAGDQQLGRLVTESTIEVQVDVPEGGVTFTAASTFLMEDTGLPHDVGAWLQCTRDGVPLL